MKMLSFECEVGFICLLLANPINVILNSSVLRSPSKSIVKKKLCLLNNLASFCDNAWVQVRTRLPFWHSKGTFGINKNSPKIFSWAWQKKCPKVTYIIQIFDLCNVTIKWFFFFMICVWYHCGILILLQVLGLRTSLRSGLD